MRCRKNEDALRGITSKGVTARGTSQYRSNLYHGARAPVNAISTRIYAMLRAAEAGRIADFTAAHPEGVDFAYVVPVVPLRAIQRLINPIRWPCGSVKMAKVTMFGISVGGTTVLPPSSPAFLSAASRLGTAT